MKISKEEKSLIKAIVNLRKAKWLTLDKDDANSLEYECTGIINNRNMEYRQMVEDYIITLIEGGK